MASIFTHDEEHTIWQARLDMAERELTNWRNLARDLQARAEDAELNYRRIFNLNAVILARLEEYRAALEIYSPDHPLVTGQIPGETIEERIERDR